MGIEDLSINHFNEEYSKYGFSAQRMYPNEALCRFLGVNVFLCERKREYQNS